MLIASGSPLAGGRQPPMNKIVSVKVLRAFLIKVERQEVGSIVQMDLRLAQDLASANKVEILKQAPAAPAPSVAEAPKAAAKKGA